MKRLKHVRLFENFTNDTQKRDTTLCTLTITKQSKAFNQNTGQYVSLENLNQQYTNYIIEEMKKVGINLIKKYTINGITYLEFDVEGNIYKNPNTSQILDNANKFWERESKKLVS